MQINVLPPWTHPQRGDPSLPSHTKDSLGYTSYVGKGKIFGPTHNSQAVEMFIGAKKDALANIPSPSRSQPQAFNSVGMMTRTQLVVSARTPRTPSRGLVASPIIFHHENSPYTTHKAAVIVNVTSTLVEPEVALVGSRGSQDLPTDATTYVKNVDVREYHSDFKEEHITTVEWRAQVES